MELDKKLCIVIIVTGDNLENLRNTINNLKENGFTNKEFVVNSKDVSENIKKYCIEENIKIYSFNSNNDIYYELPKSIDFNYISFIHEGDRYSKGFKSILNTYLNNNDENDNIYVCPINNNQEKKYILNKSLMKQKIVKIEENPYLIWLQLKSAFINKKLFSKIQPSTEELVYYTEQNLITKLISINRGYTVLDEVELIAR